MNNSTTHGNAKSEVLAGKPAPLGWPLFRLHAALVLSLTCGFTSNLNAGIQVYINTEGYNEFIYGKIEMGCEVGCLVLGLSHPVWIAQIRNVIDPSSDGQFFTQGENLAADSTSGQARYRSFVPGEGYVGVGGAILDSSENYLNLSFDGDDGVYEVVVQFYFSPTRMGGSGVDGDHVAALAIDDEGKSLPIEQGKAAIDAAMGIGQPSVPELQIAGRTEEALLLTVTNLPAGQTFHLRCSTALQDFSVPSPSLDFDSTTPQPLLVPINVSAVPKYFLQIYSGPSAP